MSSNRGSINFWTYTITRENWVYAFRTKFIKRMVRKWSYLNSFDHISNKNLLPLKALKTFKVFRKTTRFKKFNKGISLMVRKKYAKRKYKTTWLFLTYTTQAWTSHYLKSRQFERFFQSLGLFNAKAYSADYDVFRISTANNTPEAGLNIFSCSWSVAKHYLNSQSPLQSTLQVRLIKDSKVSYVHALTPTDLSKSESAYPLATNYDNILYHPHTESVNSSNYLLLLQGLNTASFAHNSQYIIACRQILILLTLKYLK